MESLNGMNRYHDETRKRSQNLLIVEGKHEKNKLFWLIFKCFPEININMDDIWIYGTNIYQLYDDIVKEYGEQWVIENEDIDLPFVISKKQKMKDLCYKEDFTNIILVFDYERHDTHFSEEKINGMQSCFTDAADMGKLYINYPMIESYQHLCGLPDEEYRKRSIPVSLQPGREYKAMVERDTVIGSLVDFPHRVEDLLKDRFHVENQKKREKCCEDILNISDAENIGELIDKALKGVVDDSCLQTAKYQLIDWMNKQNYANRNQTYWRYMRYILQKVIEHNICKANQIQYKQYEIPEKRYKDYFERIDFSEILRVQNLSGRDDRSGIIWVLNTCVLFVAEYNFNLLME